MKWREPIGLTLALLIGAAQASPCALVFGQGRNEVALEDNRWDELNQRFNAQTVATLEAAGQRVFAVLGSTHEIDPAAHLADLLQLAAAHGCITVIETTVFADLDSETLIARLRVYPVLPAVAGQDGHFGLRMGQPMYVNQRDAAYTPQALTRFKAEAVAALMAAEYLQHTRRKTGK